nr:MAG TPA: hypothetical protein [Caudoviricetes sp.]
MRLKNADYVLLKVIRGVLLKIERTDLAGDLGELLERYEKSREVTRERNRLAMRKLRAARKEAK